MFPSRTKPTEMEILFKALGSKDPDKRYHALMEAQELTSQQLTQLVQASIRRERRSSWRKRTRVGIVSVMVAGGLLSFPVSFFLVGILVCVHIAMSDFAHPLADEQRLQEIDRDAYRNGVLRAANNWHDENLLRVMERAPDSRCVEAVLWMLGTAQGTARARLLDVLMYRLPEVRTDETREWTARQKEPLLLLLRSWHGHTQLACAILKAMPEIGGAWALETVERLAELEQWETERVCAAYKKAYLETAPWEERHSYIVQPNPTPREIEETVGIFHHLGNVAAACLPLLREKVQGEEAAQVLLRASFAGSSPEQLLRPVGENGAQPDTTNLLRPGMQPAPQSEETVLTRGQ